MRSIVVGCLELKGGEMKYLKEYFPIPLILFGGIMADVSRHGFGEDILTVQIVAWTSVVVGGIGLARIIWNKVRNGGIQ